MASNDRNRKAEFYREPIQCFPIASARMAASSLSRRSWPKTLPLHIAFALSYSVVHTGAMMGLRVFLMGRGALARPVWTLLPYEGEWRWMRDRRDTPWYPTMRLFRQPAPGDWATPLVQIARKLNNFKAGGGVR